MVYRLRLRTLTCFSSLLTQQDAFIAGTYWHRVINIWNALPDTVVTAPSAVSFKKRLCLVDINKYCFIFFPGIVAFRSHFCPF